MLFLISYRPKGGRVEGEEGRVLDMFVKWKPPAGVTVKAHYVRADGGGLVIVDADSALALVEGNATWQPFYDYGDYADRRGRGGRTRVTAGRRLARVQSLIGSMDSA